MKITKYVHACVLVEDEEHTGLFDPGRFSWESGLFKLDSLQKLDFVMISHEHFDHFYGSFIDALHSKFPDVMFFSTPNVVSQLKRKGIEKALSLSHDHVMVQALAHESMEPLAPSPQVQNVALHYKNKISHPGDSLNLKISHDVLFMPLAGPWGSAIDAIRMAVKLKPKAVLPIHDWMWNDQWRQTMYDRMEQLFPRYDIKFLRPVDGQTIEVSL